MNRKTLFPALATLTIVSACVTASNTGYRGNTIVQYIACVDDLMTLGAVYYVEKYKKPPNSSVLVDGAMLQCRSELNLAVAEVIGRVKTKNGWTSVKPEVQPAIRDNLEAIMREDFLTAASKIRVVFTR